MTVSITTSAGANPLAVVGRRYEPGADRTRPSVYLKWIDAFETGSSDIDALHRELIQDCNSLLLLIENDARFLKQFA